MKKIVAVTAFALAFLALVSVAEPSGCVVRSRAGVVQHHAHAAAIVHHATPVVTAVFTPVAVAVPAYSVGYSYGQGDTNALAAEVKSLRQEIEISRLRGELNAAKQPATQPDQPIPLSQPRKSFTPVPAPTPSPHMPLATSVNDRPAHPAIAIMTKACLNCHSAEAKKGGFDMTGNLTHHHLLKIASSVYEGDMPPNKKLTDEEVGQIMSWIRGLK